MTLETSDIQQRRRLAILTRGPINEPWYRPGTLLLPRELFKGFSRVEALYDELEKLLEANRHHTREARRLRDLALKSEADARAKVNDALGTGGDAAKVRDRSDDHATKSEEHIALANRATDRASVKARQLAVEIQAVAPDIFASLDAKLEASAADIEAAQLVLRADMEHWGADWTARRMLSNIAFYGGHIPDYDPSSVVPPEFTAAEAAVGKLLAGPELLRKDEAQIRDERERGVHA